MEEVLINKAIIYIIEHKTNNNIKYVGQTIDRLNRRWQQHLQCFKDFNRVCYRLCFFVNYYGVENFSIREYKIFKDISRKYLDDEEKKYIYEFGTLNTSHANEDITIKITNEMKNEFINRLLISNISFSDLNKLVYKFQYNFIGNKLDFVLNDINAMLINDLKSKTDICENTDQDLEFKEKVIEKKTAYQRHLDRVNISYRDSKQIEVADTDGNMKNTTEKREEKRLYYHSRDKHTMNRQRILREYHNSNRKLTKGTIEKYKITEEELKK